MLLDQFGRPLPPRSVLTADQAAPTVTGVRQPYAGHPSANLTPYKLATLLREAEDGDPTRYLELAEDMEEKDPHYSGVLGTRKRAVAQQEILVEAASDDPEAIRHADLVRGIVQHEEMADVLFDIMDAIGKGFSVTEIIWRFEGNQALPERFEYRDPRHFLFDRVDGRTLLKRDNAGWLPLEGFKYIVHTPKLKSGLPIRGGLARPIAWAFLFKNYSVKDWVIFMETYGHPVRVGKWGNGASQADKDILLQAVANIGSDAAAIIPDSMLIEFVEVKTSGSHDLFERFCDWVDRQISKLVLGQTLTTEVKGGSLAAAHVHNDVREDLRRADARQLAATLNRDLVKPIIDLNFGPQQAYPKLKVGLPDPLSVIELSGILKELVPLGLTVEKSWVRDRIGAPEPASGADVLGPPPAPALLPPPTRTALHNQSQPAPIATADTIDGMTGELLAEWHPVMEPIMAPIRRMAEAAATPQEFLDRLGELVGQIDTNPLGEQMARASFAARLAGMTDPNHG